MGKQIFMKWITRINVNNNSDLPRDRQFLGLWKGIICLIEYDEEENRFYMANQPSSYGCSKISQERECKITHFCILEMPDNY